MSSYNLLYLDTLLELIPQSTNWIGLVLSTWNPKFVQLPSWYRPMFWVLVDVWGHFKRHLDCLLGDEVGCLFME